MRLRARHVLALLVAAATLLLALLIGAFLAWLFTEVLPPGSVVEIDGRRLLPHEHLPAGAGGWALVVLGVLLLALLLVVVVPLALLLGLAVPAVGGTVALAMALLALALVLASIAALVAAPWLLARAWRRRRGPLPPGPTTIEG